MTDPGSAEPTSYADACYDICRTLDVSTQLLLAQFPHVEEHTRAPSRAGGNLFLASQGPRSPVQPAQTLARWHTPHEDTAEQQEGQPAEGQHGLWTHLRRAEGASSARAPLAELPCALNDQSALELGGSPAKTSEQRARQGSPIRRAVAASREQRLHRACWTGGPVPSAQRMQRGTMQHCFVAWRDLRRYHWLIACRLHTALQMRARVRCLDAFHRWRLLTGALRGPCSWLAAYLSALR